MVMMMQRVSSLQRRRPGIPLAGICLVILYACAYELKSSF